MVRNKKNKEKLNKILIIALFLSFAVAVLDIFSANHFWKAMGDLSAEAYILAEAPYMTLFWGFVYVAIFAIILAYYFGSKDKSESLAIGITSYIFVMSGLTDFLYFKLQGKIIPTDMYWLIDNPAGMFSKYILGLSTVNPLGLFLNIVVFMLVGVVIAKWLIRQ